MKKILLIPLIVVANFAYAQQEVVGTVVDEQTGRPLARIAVSSNSSNIRVLTDKDGKFNMKIDGSSARLELSGQGYELQTLTASLPLRQPLMVKMHLKTASLEDVSVTTGYQRIPKERATGSFATVGKELFNKQVTTNIMERLPAIASGVMIDQSTSSVPQIMVRGISTMQGPKSPLIILDDFPYEGNLSNLSPDIVESVTILKDAAASSIWGARAANGVIVITTKKGKFNQPFTVDLTATTSMESIPDLNYLKQMSSSDFIDVEQELYSRGYYNGAINSSNRPVLTPVIDLLDQVQKGLLSQEDANRQINVLRSLDGRDQYRNLFYTPALKQQYSLDFSGGSNKMSWTSALGYDHNTSNLSAKYERLNFRLQNIWKPTDRLTVSAGVLYMNTRNESGKSEFSTISKNGRSAVPYLQFADENGNPLVMFTKYNQRFKNKLVDTGLLDWNYYPLTDWQHSVNRGKTSDIILNSSIRYKLLKGLEAEVRYQYQETNRNSETLNDEQSYYARDYINNFAYYDSGGLLKFRVPKGSILDHGTNRASIHNFRGQLNYHYNSEKHDLSAIAGGEVRTSMFEINEYRDYGYDRIRKAGTSVDLTTPYPQFVTGGSDFISDRRSIQESNTNFISLYSNAAYTYLNKYTISGSVRRDASNLFGLTTNNQWNPFWSGGFAWKISDESFYPFSWLPKLKLRGSYGFSGNIDPAMVAVTTIIYDANPSNYTNSPTARIDQYNNPSLQWETSRMINVALDFSTQNDSFSGSLDFFTKKGYNLFGPAPLDYTTGISTLLMNVAGMKGHGVDLILHSRNLRTSKFEWNTTLNLSTYKDEVTDYFSKNTFANAFVSSTGNSVLISGTVGKPVYSIFAYKWAGLDPETGDPQGILDGEISKNYSSITGYDKGIEELDYFGSAIPTTFGSLLNSFGYKSFNLDFGITYKLGYWFRRSSINYTALISDKIGHSDYANRWQALGDEQSTNVPSVIYSTNNPRDLFYSGSSALVEKADHIRLQYVTLGYELTKNQWIQLPVNSLKLMFAVNNLGILWRANDRGLDPDYSFGYATLKPATTFSFGFNMKF